MAKANILSLYINTASFKKEYAWYHAGEDGSVSVELMSEESDGPPVYEALKKRDLTRNRALVLFQSKGGGGVFWGRDALVVPSDDVQGDRMRRTLGYAVLVEFAELRDAVELYAGLLRHWWPCQAADGPALPALASRVGAVAEKRQLSPDEQLHPVLLALLKQWHGESEEEAGSEALLREGPLLALEGPARLRELQAYLRHDLLRSGIVRQGPPDTVQPLVVVARTLVPERLQGVWRALTDIEDEALRTPATWKETGDAIAKPLPLKPVVPEPFMPGKATQIAECPSSTDTEGLTVGQATKPRSSDAEDAKPPCTRSRVRWYLFLGTSLVPFMWLLRLFGLTPRSK